MSAAARWRALIALLLIFVAGCGQPGFPTNVTAGRLLPPIIRASLPARSSSFLGVYEPGVPGNFRLVEGFAARIGRMPNLLLYYRHWGQPFDLTFANEALVHGAVPVVQLDPGKVPLSAIAAGHDLGYLRSFAAQVRQYGRPVVMGFAREMNGNWYSWGRGHIRPRVWVAAWRRVVTEFRRNGADNAIWQWTVNATGPGVRSPVRWWPGYRYVDWVGIDGYYYTKYYNFENVFGRTIAIVRRMTRKPIVISEVGMDPAAARAWQFKDLLADIRARHLLGLVWFDARARRDWRLEDNPRALAEFRREVGQITYRKRNPG